MMVDQERVFEAARPRLRSLAYRMLGVFADADDVVQEAWLRWSSADQAEIRVPDAWLNTTTSRLALDRLRRRRREQADYIGPWLPEPIVSRLGDPEDAAELADSLTLGFLILLERLSPDERAAFLLADVFFERGSTIAATLDRSEAACRQLASRARRKLRDGGSDRASTGTGAHRGGVRALSDRFVGAIAAGDEAAALACVSGDVELVSDGGGKRHAARRPVVGAERVVRFLLNVAKRADPAWTIEPADVGGLVGLAMFSPGSDGPIPEMMMGFDVVAGQVIRVLVIRNPDKMSMSRIPAN